MATESVAPAAVPTQVLIPARDLIALRDEIDLMQLAVYGYIHGPEEGASKAMEIQALRLADRVATLVGEYAAAADV